MNLLFQFFIALKTPLKLQRHFIAVLLLFHMIVLVFAPISTSYSQKFTDNEVKAALVFKFPVYVRWPENAMNDDMEKFRCCIIGEDPMVKFLTQFNGEKLIGKTIHVKQISDIDTLEDCLMLYICSSEKGKLAEIMKSIEGKPVLTIGNMKAFATNGGIINFIMKEGSVHFEINPEAGKKAGLEINSKLLRIANISGNK